MEKESNAVNENSQNRGGTYFTLGTETDPIWLELEKELQAIRNGKRK